MLLVQLGGLEPPAPVPQAGLLRFRSQPWHDLLGGSRRDHPKRHPHGALTALAKLPNLSAMTLDELGAKMRCKKCGKRPERFYAANHSDTPGFVRSF
jgi:hypothetical protein